MSENETNNKDETSDQKIKNEYKYNIYNIINVQSNKDYYSYLQKLAKMRGGAVTFYINPELWGEFNRVVMKVDPFKSRSEVLTELIVEWCAKHNTKDMKITQFIFNKPEQVNIQPKIELNVAQKLEVKLITKDLAGLLEALEKRRGDPNFYMTKLRKILPKATRAYEKTSDEQLHKLLEKASKWLER